MSFHTWPCFYARRCCWWTHSCNCLQWWPHIAAHLEQINDLWVLLYMLVQTAYQPCLCLWLWFACMIAGLYLVGHQQNQRNVCAPRRREDSWPFDKPTPHDSSSAALVQPQRFKKLFFLGLTFCCLIWLFFALPRFSCTLGSCNHTKWYSPGMDKKQYKKYRSEKIYPKSCSIYFHWWRPPLWRHDVFVPLGSQGWSCFLHCLPLLLTS